MKQSGTLVASVSLLIGILLMVHPSPAASASPREQLYDFFRKATTVLSEASDASQARHEIRQLARPLFDVPGAARRVLEPEWSALSVVEREGSSAGPTTTRGMGRPRCSRRWMPRVRDPRRVSSAPPR